MVRWYEAMFLFDSSMAAKDGQDGETHLKELLAKHGVEIHSFEKWDERRLAYEINRVRRGIYFLVVCKMEPERIAALKRDCNLSEHVLRHLIIQDDKLLARIEERVQLKKKREEEAAQAAAEGLPPRRRR